MALAPDYADSGLNEFMKLLITAYSRIPWANDLAVSILTYLFLIHSFPLCANVRLLVWLRLL